MNQRCHSFLKSSAVVAFGLGLLPVRQAASAQFSTSAYSLVGVTNDSGLIATLNGSGSDGSPTSASITKSFTGMNGAGATQTMTWSGSTTASAQFGRLRCRTDGSLANSYFNAANIPFANQHGGIANTNGSPTSLISLGFAWFDDTLQFGGELQSGYKARYVFQIHGTNSGTGTFGALTFTIEGHPAENFFLYEPAYNTMWATQSYEVNGITPQRVQVQFSTQVVFDTRSLTDGGNYAGTSDFSSTAVLEAIEMVDQNNNPVYGWTVTAESGTEYLTRNFDPATTSDVSGVLSLQGMGAGGPAQPIAFVFRPNDNSGDVTRTVSVPPSGVFRLLGIPRKNGVLHIKGERSLARNVAVNATHGNVSGVTADMRTGDANDDNWVDITDLLLLIGVYNKVIPDLDYLSAADFNLDGANDITDLLLLIGNYNQTGDN